MCPWDTPPAAKVSGTDPSPASGREGQQCLTGKAALLLSSSFDMYQMLSYFCRFYNHQCFLSVTNVFFRLCPRDARPSPVETWCYVDCPIDCEVTPWTPWDDSKCSCGEKRKLRQYLGP